MLKGKLSSTVAGIESTHHTQQWTAGAQKLGELCEKKNVHKLRSISNDITVILSNILYRFQVGG